ncbi:MAG: hypothetical protein LBC02_12410 [Planctomycetaceae bacterium]|jgi:hypothetical protein|nr:hypothetical protein [Planctomycetaceae bacterium]
MSITFPVLSFSFPCLSFSELGLSFLELGLNVFISKVEGFILRVFYTLHGKKIPDEVKYWRIIAFGHNSEVGIPSAKDCLSEINYQLVTTNNRLTV